MQGICQQDFSVERVLVYFAKGLSLLYLVEPGQTSDQCANDPDVRLFGRRILDNPEQNIAHTDCTCT